MINYDDNGNLILSGKLGEAVVNNDFEVFTEAQISGKSEDGLTYRDMADFNEFVSNFFRLGVFPGSRVDNSLILIRKVDQAPFGIATWEFETDDPDLHEWCFVPMQPFQGYEPAE